MITCLTFIHAELMQERGWHIEDAIEMGWNVCNGGLASTSRVGWNVSVGTRINKLHPYFYMTHSIGGI